MQLSSEVLKQMNDEKFTNNESKIFLSEKVLLLSLKILEIIGEKSNNNYQLNTFRKFNKSQTVLLGYLKMKFPRGGQTFVPVDLLKVFKSFNMVEYPENDMLRKAMISFTNSDNHEIVKTLKTFFNTLMD